MDDSAMSPREVVTSSAHDRDAARVARAAAELGVPVPTTFRLAGVDEGDGHRGHLAGTAQDVRHGIAILSRLNGQTIDQTLADMTAPPEGGPRPPWSPPDDWIDTEAMLECWPNATASGVAQSLQQCWRLGTARCRFPWRLGRHHGDHHHSHHLDLQPAGPSCLRQVRRRPGRRPRRRDRPSRADQGSQLRPGHRPGDELGHAQRTAHQYWPVIPPPAPHAEGPEKI